MSEKLTEMQENIRRLGATSFAAGLQVMQVSVVKRLIAAGMHDAARVVMDMPLPEVKELQKP